MTTPIEDRALWAKYRAAADAARECGADFACSVEAGFASVENREPQLCDVCKKRGVTTNAA